MTKHIDKMLSDAELAIQRGDDSGAFKTLKSALSRESDFLTQMRAAKTFSGVNKEHLGLRPIKIALLASSTIDHFCEVLKLWLAADGLAAQIWIAPFDTITPTILNNKSPLYSFEPDIVWIFTTHRDLRIQVSALDSKSVQSEIGAEVDSYRNLWNSLQKNLSCTVIQNNADIPAIDPFGNYAGHLSGTKRNILRRFNLELATETPPELVIFDLDHLASNFGRSRWIAWRYWYHSKHPFSFDAYGVIAQQASRLIRGLSGHARKCIVVDLDNTLWGGVVGDDGLLGIHLGEGAEGEAFSDFQSYLRDLKNRGVILAVCSKNDEETAKEPFLSHSGMRLSLNDLSVFCANWNNKAENVEQIAHTLNISLDSIVFIDDNPVERDLIRVHHPEVAVPEMPTDPSEYISTIDQHQYFETTRFSTEDVDRTSYYQANAERSRTKRQFVDIEMYLQSLEMKAEKGSMSNFYLPRISQLINKSNQFHLTTTRYSESQLRVLSSKSDWIIRYFKLTDKFGDNGLISSVILHLDGSGHLVIDTWVMSCRVLSRTMEEYVYNDILKIAKKLQVTVILGKFIPTKKNGLVSSLYHQLGFKMISDDGGATTWRLDVGETDRPLKTWVT
jgi:FkbH-like protein